MATKFETKSATTRLI